MPGKKSKFTLNNLDVRSALAAYKLVHYMNYRYNFDGTRSVCSINNTQIDNYAQGLSFKGEGFAAREPSVSSAIAPDEDHPLFMTFDWLRLEHRHQLLDIEQLPARFKQLKDFSRIYFYEASIRTIDTSKRIVNVDLRLGDDKLTQLKETANPASSLLKSIRDNISRILRTKAEIYLVLEAVDRSGRPSPHFHGTILIDKTIKKSDLRKPLRLALGEFDPARQILCTEPYPKRAAYLSKQTIDTPKHLLEQNFKSEKYLAASNNVRRHAKEIWENEVRITNDANPGEKILSQFMDAVVAADLKASRILIEEESVTASSAETL